MTFIPHTPEETRAMLDVIGADSIDDLFADIPPSLRLEGLDLPPALDEMRANEKMRESATWNFGQKDCTVSFLGGGAYEHFIPASVPALAFRGEFATAYTPYQAEASQGTLQAIYEFQTMICALTELEVANASLYDGASALAEAALMAMRVTRKTTLLVPKTLNPRYRETLATYVGKLNAKLVEIPMTDRGVSDLEALNALADEHANELAAVIIPGTNFLGACEQWNEMTDAAQTRKALAIAVVNPLSLGVLEAPGNWGGGGADIAVGEAQPLGLPLAWGGPYCGFMSCREKHLRKMPGRLVGCTTDADGKRGYTLTLQTREQHIRRDKATSNICTNQGLMALQVCIHMALIGKQGLRNVALANLERAAELRRRLLEVPGIEAVTGSDYFNEFTVKLPLPARTLINEMRDHLCRPGIDGAVAGFDPNWLIVCVTETKTDNDFDNYIGDLQMTLNKV